MERKFCFSYIVSTMEKEDWIVQSKQDLDDQWSKGLLG